MVATCIKKIKHGKLCVTDVYLRDTLNSVIPRFALECESSECLLFLLFVNMQLMAGYNTVDLK